MTNQEKTTGANQGRACRLSQPLDPVVAALTITPGGILAFALLFEATVVGDVAGGLLHGALYALTECRRFFLDRILVVLTFR